MDKSYFLSKFRYESKYLQEVINNFTEIGLDIYRF